MLKISEIFEFSRENSYFERIRMVRMVRMVRSLADRTFQLWVHATDLREEGRVGPAAPEAGRVHVLRPQPLLGLVGLRRQPGRREERPRGLLLAGPQHAAADDARRDLRRRRALS